MPMEPVQFVQRHHVHHRLHFLFSEEMATHVDHQPAPRKARYVGDFHAGDFPVEILHSLGRKDFRWQQLQQRLHTVKQTRLRRRVDGDDVGRDRQVVAFGAQVRFGVFGGQNNRTAAEHLVWPFAQGSLDGVACGRAQPFRQELTGVLGSGIGGDDQIR
jgi:hypothetical protein